MFKTDYDIEWTGPYQATLSWEGDSSDSWWSVYLDGSLVSKFEDSGSIELKVTMDERFNHSIAIIQHNAADDDVASPEALRLLMPTVKWLAVDNAVKYEVYRIIDDVSYLVHTLEVTDTVSDIYNWQVPTELVEEDLISFQARVYAYGSFGEEEVSSIVSGFAAGYPTGIDSVDVMEESDGDLYLILE